MENIKLDLNKYETQALKESLIKYIPILEDQVKSLKNTKYSSGKDKKEMIRNMSKRSDLLKEILKKLE